MACRSCRSCVELLPRHPAPLVVRARRAGSIIQQLSPSRPRGSHPPTRRTFGTTAARNSEASHLQNIINTRSRGLTRRIFPRSSELGLLYSTTEGIYKAAASQADYEISREDRKNDTIKRLEGGEEVGAGGGVWHDDFHLPATFGTWSQVTMLHLYLIVVRLRCLEREASRAWQKQLEEHFFWDAEARMDVKHAVTSSSIRQRYLKDLLLQWRGAMFSYDEGLVAADGAGDAVLAAAVWRNVFAARDDIDVRHLAAVVGWMRQCLQALDRMPDSGLQTGLQGVFQSSPLSQLRLVDEPTEQLRSFEAEVREVETGTPKKEVKSRFS